MPDDLWDGVPEAEAFCDSVIRDIDRHKLFPGEKFADFTIGVFATTGLDLHGEYHDLQNLKDAEARISSRPLWANVMHEPTIQPCGRVVAARVFRSSRSGEYLLAGVTGRYPTESLPSFLDVGITPQALTEAASQLPPAGSATLEPVLGFDPNDLDEALVLDALREAPEEMGLRVQRTFRKDLDPLSIVTLFISLTAILNTPFAAELQKEAAKAFFQWLRMSVFPRICRSRRTMLEFVDIVGGCRVQFICEASSPALLSEASAQLVNGAGSALSLLSKFGHLKFDLLVYEYDATAKKWLPLHAATTGRGIISDRPKLIAMDQLGGFSLAGTAGDPTPARTIVERQLALGTIGTDPTSQVPVLPERTKLPSSPAGRIKGSSGGPAKGRRKKR